MQTKEQLEIKWALLNAKHAAAHAAFKRKLVDDERRERGEALLKKIARK